MTAAAELQAEVRELLGHQDPVRQPSAVPTRAEIDTMLAASAGEMRTHLSLRLLYSTGVRLKEVAALRYADFNWAEQTVFVRDGKCSIDRYVIADHVTLKLVQQWRGDAPDDALVLGVGTQGISRRFRKFAVETGLYAKYREQGLSLSPHSFRFAFATHCLENGMDVSVVKALLGHRHLETTRLYLGSAHTERQDECEKTVFPGLNAWFQ